MSIIYRIGYVLDLSLYEAEISQNGKTIAVVHFSDEDCDQETQIHFSPNFDGKVSFDDFLAILGDVAEEFKCIKS